MNGKQKLNLAPMLWCLSCRHNHLPKSNEISSKPISRAILRRPLACAIALVAISMSAVVGLAQQNKQVAGQSRAGATLLITATIVPVSRIPSPAAAPQVVGSGPFVMMVEWPRVVYSLNFTEEQDACASAWMDLGEVAASCARQRNPTSHGNAPEAPRLRTVTSIP